MKKALLVLLALAIIPAFVVAEEDSTTKKLIKLKVVQDADDDSLIKKGAKLKAADEIISDPGDSTLKKAAKVKVMDDVTD